MALKFVCSGHLVWYPLEAMSWRHLRYLVGLRQLGHDVIFFEIYGWRDSCYRPVRTIMGRDPSYDIDYLLTSLRPFGLEERWCCLAEDGNAYGLRLDRDFIPQAERAPLYRASTSAWRAS